MVEIEIVYEGELRCGAVHGPSGASVATDAPVDNCGRGESFSPTDLVAAATGACMLTIMGIRADQNGWDVSGARLTVEKHMVADPVRRIGKLEVVVRVPHTLDKRARAVLEEAAQSCPVAESLHPGIEVPLRFEWGDPSAGTPAEEPAPATPAVEG